MSSDIQLGKYFLLEELGRGGFGTVYKANDSIGRTVAIKVLKPGWSDDPSTIERFRREAKTAGELFHSHIATIIDFDEFEGRLFLVMRYVDGISLDQFIEEKGHLDWDEAVHILGEVAGGLDYAHKRGFIHRDIKPANILVSENEGAVLTDFGLVKAAETSGLSTSGVMLGTPNYIAPEIWEGGKVTSATDEYSMACVFYEMITGEVLFTGESAPQIMTKHVLNRPQFPENWPEGVPLGVEEVLIKALDRDYEQRFNQITAFVSGLHDLDKEVGKGMRDYKSAESITLDRGDTQTAEQANQVSTDKKYNYDPEKYKIQKLPNPNLLLWILMPVFAFNEVILGQRMPKVSLIDRTSDAPIVEKTYIPCENCGALNDARLWSKGNGFGHWFGLVCPQCGKNIPCLWNFTSYLLLAITSPVWIWFKILGEKKWLEYELKRMERMCQSELIQVQDWPWAKMGFLFGVIFFILMAFPMGVLFGFELESSLIIISVMLPLSLGAGLLWGYFMKKAMMKNK